MRIKCAGGYKAALTRDNIGRQPCNRVRFMAALYHAVQEPRCALYISAGPIFATMTTREYKFAQKKQLYV